MSYSLSKDTVGVIGIGLMGSAITHRLLDHGFQVRVWSRFAEEADEVIARGALWSDHPLAECDRVIVCLYSSEVVADVFGKMSADLRQPQIIIDITTGWPDDTLKMAEHLASKGISYLDAPFSGSSAQTRQGQALLMIGGDRTAFDSCSDLWKCLANQYHHIGPAGSAARMKLVTNLVLGLNRAALAEGLSYARALGFSPETALTILRRSPAASAVMQTKGEKMIAADFSVQAKLAQHLKDVQIILETSRAKGLHLPLSDAHRRLLESVVEQGLGELDNSAIICAYPNHSQRGGE